MAQGRGIKTKQEDLMDNIKFLRIMIQKIKNGEIMTTNEMTAILKAVTNELTNLRAGLFPCEKFSEPNLPDLEDYKDQIGGPGS